MHYGIDVGGTKTEFAVFDENFERVRTHRVDTPTENYDDYLGLIKSLVGDADLDFGRESTVGVGVTGIVDRRGNSLSANVPCINGRNVQKDLTDKIGRSVRCINDVRAFALSEARGGAAKGYKTMVGVILGTGAASGYCQNGVPMIGVNGVAGEWGHLPIDASLVSEFDLPIYNCSCGKAGCFELYVSGPGLTRLASHFSGRHVDSVECISRMRDGEPDASRSFSVWLECLSSVFTQLVLHSNPEVIVIGGGMSNIDEIYDLLPGLMAKKLLSCVAPPPILKAKFGDDSGVRGAAIVGAEG